MARRTFTSEFKTAAAKLVTEQGCTAAQAARSLGVDPNSIRDGIRRAADSTNSSALLSADACRPPGRGSPPPRGEPPAPDGAGDLKGDYQITSALKHLSLGKHVAVLPDARFSGVSTGACIGHVGPAALAGGPIGRLRDGDLIRIVVDRRGLEGSVDLVGHEGVEFGVAEGSCLLAERTPHTGLAPDPDLPDDTRLWAALQAVGGGTWGAASSTPRPSSPRSGRGPAKETSKSCFRIPVD
jgi:hypothetical protein